MADNLNNFESNMLSVVEFDIFAQFPLKQVNHHTPIQLLFYLEHIYWYYIDNYAKKDKENQFPNFSFDEFVKKVAMPRLNLPSNPQKIDDLLKKFHLYKSLVPTSGAVILDPSCKYVVMTRAPGSHQWYFPKGKINNGEDAEEGAIREVAEEIGVDVKKLLNPTEFVQIVRNVNTKASAGAKASAACASQNGQQDMETGENLEDSPQFDQDLAAIDRDIAASGNKQYCILFFVVGLSLDTTFIPRTEDEIEECRWFSLKELRDHIRTVVSTRRKGIPIKDEFYFARLVLFKLFDWLKLHHLDHKSPSSKELESPVAGSPVSGSPAQKHTNSEKAKKGRRSLTPTHAAAASPSRSNTLSNRPSNRRSAANLAATTCPKPKPNKNQVSSFLNKFGIPVTSAATGVPTAPRRQSQSSAVLINAASELETATNTTWLSNSFSGSAIPRVKSESVFMPAVDDSSGHEDSLSPTPSSSNEASPKNSAEFLEEDFTVPSAAAVPELKASISNSSSSANHLIPTCDSISDLVRALSSFSASAWPNTNDLSN